MSIHLSTRSALEISLGTLASASISAANVPPPRSTVWLILVCPCATVFGGEGTVTDVGIAFPGIQATQNTIQDHQ